MRGVIVSTQDGYRDTTNWRGVCYVPVNFDTLTVAKVNYIAERIGKGELTDSTFLIPNGKAISEVTVWGKNNIQETMTNGIVGYKPLPDPDHGTLFEFDLAKMLDSRTRRDHKHLRNVKQKFQEMDGDDPIVRAYNQALEEQEQKAADEERKKNK